MNNNFNIKYTNIILRNKKMRDYIACCCKNFGYLEMYLFFTLMLVSVDCAFTKTCQFFRGGTRKILAGDQWKCKIHIAEFFTVEFHYF